MAPAGGDVVGIVDGEEMREEGVVEMGCDRGGRLEKHTEHNQPLRLLHAI